MGRDDVARGAACVKGIGGVFSSGWECHATDLELEGVCCATRRLHFVTTRVVCRLRRYVVRGTDGFWIPARHWEIDTARRSRRLDTALYVSFIRNLIIKDNTTPYRMGYPARVPTSLSYKNCFEGAAPVLR
jgi:hypothetical protein